MAVVNCIVKVGFGMIEDGQVEKMFVVWNGNVVKIVVVLGGCFEEGNGGAFILEPVEQILFQVTVSMVADGIDVRHCGLEACFG